MLIILFCKFKYDLLFLMLLCVMMVYFMSTGEVCSCIMKQYNVNVCLCYVGFSGPLDLCSSSQCC